MEDRREALIGSGRGHATEAALGAATAATAATSGAPAGVVPQRVASSRHFFALMRKNRLLKKREWSAQCCPWCPLAACCELLLPIAVLALLWWAKSECNGTGQCELPILEGWGGHMPEKNKSTVCVEGLELEASSSLASRSSCNAWTKYLLEPVDFAVVLAYMHWTGERIVLAADHASDFPKVEKFRKTITEEWFPDLYLKNIPCIPLERDLLGKLETAIMPGKEKNKTLPCMKKKVNPGILPGFANLTHPKILTSSELENYMESGARIFGAIVFHEIPSGEKGSPGDWAYSIRLNVSAGTTIFTQVPPTRPLDLGLRMNEAFTYFKRGFITLQLLVDRYIIDWPSDVELTEETRRELLLEGGLRWAMNETPETQAVLAEHLRYLPQSVNALPMPVAGRVIDGFYELIALAFPLVFIVAFLYTQKKVLNELISEKETKVRESLRMLGVRSFAIISSWFVTYGIIFAALCAIFAIVASFYVFPGSSLTLIFMFFWLWCMSFLAFAWFIHCFFNQSRTGGIVGMIIMFAQWIVYSSQNRQGPPSESVTILLMLMPNAAFCTGLQTIAKFEAARVGVQWGDVFMEVRNCSFISVLGMMCLDIVLFTALGWYFDRVLPKEYGVRLSPNFIFRRSFWQSISRSADGDAAATAEEAALHGPSAQCAAAEEVPQALRLKSAASGCVVRTLALGREFQTPAGKKVAVENLDMAMFEGQILALLGHNGAGKSTTINMLTGMVEPSSGDAIVAGHRLSNSIQAIRQVIGVCPQHDVLWLELTVWEHLTVYAQLRGVPAAEVTSRCNEMMQQVGLTEKAQTRAGALSGGQKRKLSLCLALIGRPPVVFLDEPTSGMDPYSRRATWNIIRAAREGRVVVLTTHFMDEAEILGDRVAIMAEGRLCVCGSSLFLKAHFGAGYRLMCARKDVCHAPSDEDPIQSAVMRHIPEAQKITDIGAELSMQLPSSSTSKFHGLLDELERNKDEIGLAHYGLSMVKLEEVFLKVASGEMDGEHPSTQNGLQEWASGVRAEGSRHVTHLAALFMKRARYGRRDMKALACTVVMPMVLLAFGLGILNVIGSRHLPPLLMDVASQFGSDAPAAFNISEGGVGDLTAALKTAHVRPQAEQVERGVADGLLFGRDYADGVPVYEFCEEHPHLFSKCWKEIEICDNIEPFLELVSTVGIGIGCSTDQQGCQDAIAGACQDGAAGCVQTCQDQASVSKGICRSKCQEVCHDAAANFSKVCDLLQPPLGTIGTICPVECAGTVPDTCQVGTVCSTPYLPHVGNPKEVLQMATLLFQEGSELPRRSDVRHGAILSTSNSTVGTSAVIFYNTSAPHAVPAFLNLLSRGLQQLRSKGSIKVTSHPVTRSRFEELNQVVSAVVDLTSTFVIIIAFSWIPPAIVAYVVREREAHHNSKHQQLISGVSIFAYWTSNFLWDVCLYVLPLAFTILFLWLFGINAFVQHGALWASFVIFAGYGLAVAPFSYLLSFLFAKHTSAQILSLVLNFLTGLLLMLTSYILNLIKNTKDVNESLMWIYRLFPGFCLGHGLFEICTNSVISRQLNTEVALLEWDVAGKDAMCMYILAPGYFFLTVLIDFLMHSPLAASSRHLDPVLQQRDIEDDPDVAAEAKRIEDGGGIDDVVRLEKLRKVYRTPDGAPKVAVQSLTFGLSLGECFAFLGTNGAGKTSTLSILTGAILPSAGKAFLGGFDVVQEQRQVRRLLGYCPQHDALLDRLTVREHLELFGRIKGIPRQDLRRVCDQMMQDLSLSPHVDKLAMTLSGGNKRKLSLAIALMGSPPLVLLDEPSTGVDPAARRLMWHVISSVSTLRKESTVILTTHNMEEAEALCSRIGIMVGGRLRCLGSNQRLKARFGQGYQLEVCLNGPEDLNGFALKHKLPASLHEIEVKRSCAELGQPGRAALIRAGCEEGFLVFDSLSREGSVSSEVFAQWWLFEDRANHLAAFLERHFPGTLQLERHEHNFRFRLPQSCPLGEVFRVLEESRDELHLHEYGVSQASLEQIFNDFAAQQEEETGPVQGLFRDGRALQDRSGSVEMMTGV